MSKQTLGGINNVLDSLLSPEEPQSRLVETKSRAAVQETHGGTAKKSVEAKLMQTSGARRGRPLGKAAPLGQPKSKITLLLSQAMVVSYRDWSWEARSQFSHLVEKALMDYYQRQRNPGPAKR